jgi:hypothetical protein
MVLHDILWLTDSPLCQPVIAPVLLRCGVQKL